MTQETTPTEFNQRCEYCGSAVDEDGREETSAAAAPVMLHTADVCRERVHAALRGWKATHSADIAQARAAEREAVIAYLVDEAIKWRAGETDRDHLYAASCRALATDIESGAHLASGASGEEKKT